MRNTKGQMRVIETILASFIFFSALTFANMLAVLPSSPKYEISDLERMGHSVFHDLDEQGILSRFVYNETEWGELAFALMIVFQPDVYFDLTIYEVHTQDQPINQHFPIRFGAPEVFTASDSTASVSYILPGQQAEYSPRILILQLVRG
ncbi:MAG: hypothetical protein JSW29_06170 [Candidatus Bathyarchaeota archaeon]|nr:MAG: hypothetical protein JSW29_06170 [Candidatus Bathyarchaeota archaeon]